MPPLSLSILRSLRGPRAARPRTAGFSAVALAVALLAASLAAFVAIPHWKKARLEARAAAVARDLQTFAAAFRQYAHDRGDWPAATLTPAEIPAGMHDRLPADRWKSPTPIGGAYAWGRDTLQRGERYHAALLIVSSGAQRVSAHREQLVAIDRLVDDGNLDTGKFRLGFRLQPTFVLEH